MNWKLKCLAFHLMDWMPLGESIHTAAQRYITGRYFQRITPQLLSAYDFHVQNFRGGVALEFGAGRSLLAPLLLSHAGAEKVYAVDLNRLATTEQINDVISQLRSLRPGHWPSIRSLDELSRYRIEYLAPGDARRTGLASASVDLVYSTSTLEHIPRSSIIEILTEAKRILKPEGSMSFQIDYHDHYSSADKRISFWNFYAYSERAWRLFNPSGHYQNRLRHSDFQQLFAELGLSAEIDRRTVQREGDLDRTALCSDFARYSREDLICANGHFVLKAHSSLAIDSDKARDRA